MGKKEFKEVSRHTLEEKYYTYSKNFDFCYRDDNPHGEGNALLILSKEEIVRFDYRKTTDQFTLVYKFQNPLED